MTFPRFPQVTLALLIAFGGSAQAANVDPPTINDAQWNASVRGGDKLSPQIIKAQVLLARARFSPGEIDGRGGDNFKKAVKAFAAEKGLKSKDIDGSFWRELTTGSSEPIITEYTIADEDVRGPFLDKMPRKLEDIQDLPALNFTSPRERLAERFHMSEALLGALNPGNSFEKSGETIFVVNVAAPALPSRVARIQVDKGTQMLRAFAEDGVLLAAYPVTVGSAEKPAPSGTLKVTNVSKNPTYRYNPNYAFKGVKARKPFTIKPGPNNPVGAVWIGLSEEGYGIHGTPEPAKVSKTESHGCIRLTNWDVSQLAAAVKKGVPVEFTGLEAAAQNARAKAAKRR